MQEIKTWKEKMKSELQDKFAEYGIPVELADTVEEFIESMMEDFLYRLHRSIKE